MKTKNKKILKKHCLEIIDENIFILDKKEYNVNLLPHNNNEFSKSSLSYCKKFLVLIGGIDGHIEEAVELFIKKINYFTDLKKKYSQLQ